METKKASKASPRELYRRITALLVVGLLAGSAVWWAYGRSQAALPLLAGQALPVTVSTKPTAVLNWPSTGQAALGAVGYGLLASHGTQKPVPTASVAKLITALMVLRMKPLSPGEQGPMLTLGQADIDLYNSYVSQGGSVSAVADGEQITEYQALQGMLLPSANNLADSLAIWAFGSLANYAQYANRQMAALGFSHTHVGSDASGLSPTTTSNVSDLVKLGELANANPILAEIVAQSSADIPVAGTIRNVNWLLGTNGINGLKTGNSDQAGGVYLFSAIYAVPHGPNVTIIGAVMDAPTLQQAMNDSAHLLASAQPGFVMGDALSAGQTIGYYQFPWSKTVITAVTTTAAKGLMWQGQALDKPTIHLSSIQPPVPSGTIVGTAGFNGSRPVSVTLSRPTPTPSIWWRLTNN